MRTRAQVGPRGAGPWDSGPRGADAPPRPRFCRADSSEEAPAGNSVGTEAAGSPEGQGGPPPEEASGPPAHALVLGGFGRSKAPKVSGPGGRLQRWGGCRYRGLCSWGGLEDGACA